MTAAEPGDRVELIDGLVHLCDYVSFNGYVHFACKDRVTDNTFMPRHVNRKPLSCVICLGQRVAWRPIP